MSTPGNSDVRDQVRRILESDSFRSAPQISRLLGFLTDATLDGEPLKESVIGSAFFNRPSGYDPQADPVVRTEVRRLRLKLSEYYQKEGADASVLIDIPAGAYKVRFASREVPCPEAAAVPPAETGAGRKHPSGFRVKIIGAVALLLLGTAAWLLPRVTGRTTRSVAVLRLRDLAGAGDTAWLGNALSEMLAADLSGADRLRTIPIDNVARTRLDVALPDAVSLGPAQLDRIRRTLGADLVVAGSYLSVGMPGSREYRIDVSIYDTRIGRPAGSASEMGDERTLFDMVSRVGNRIGRQVGVETNTTRLQQLSCALDVSQLDAASQMEVKGISRVELAKALCLKADFLPNGQAKQQLYAQALEMGRKEGPGPWELGPLNGLARIYAGRRDFVKAADFYRQGYQSSLKYYGPDHAGTAEAKVHWARSRLQIGETKEALAQIKEAIPVARRGLPPDSLTLWEILHNAIHTCNDARDFEDAESYTREALAINERLHLPPTSERWGMLYWDLGRAERGEKHYPDAIAALEKAEADFEQFPDTRTMQVRTDIEQVRAEQRAR